MSLPVPNLDDRHFQDLVDEAKRMIPELCPEWTNHNLSDPGVALIELFAWMTEMTLYRVNQVPDAFYTHMLNLLGFKRFQPRAARTNITFWLSGGSSTVTIPAGTTVSTGESVAFTTLADGVIHQPNLVAAMTSEGTEQYTDVWDDLALRLNPVTCFPRATITSGDCFYLGFDQPLENNVVRLTVEASAEGIGVIPDRPPLVWEAWQGEGWAQCSIPTLIGDTRRADTTGGLNRDGNIVLMMPAEHAAMTLGGVQAHWVRVRLVRPEAGQPTYTSSPRITSVSAATIGGRFPAEHSRAVHDEVLGVSTGRAGQTFQTALQPVLATEQGETLQVVDGTSVEDWTEVTDFVESSTDDTHYVFDSATGTIRFGPAIRQPDGKIVRHGAIPAENTVVRLTRYRSGGGAIGNVGVGKLNSLRAAIPGVSGAVNLEQALGGVDAETVDNAKLRGPQSVRAGKRAVTVSDFERLAIQADNGIARVRCLAPVEPGDPIRLLVVPNIRQAPETLELDHFALPDPMIRRIGEYLDERRILGSRIEIGTPFYQGVTVAALVQARPGRPAAMVRERALRVLYDYINPLTGGPDGQGWPFDADLNSALVFQLLDAVEGVERVEEVLFFEYDLRNHERVGFGKELVKLAPDSLFLSSNHQVVVR